MGTEERAPMVSGDKFGVSTRKFPPYWKYAFFSSACCVVAASVVGAIDRFLTLFAGIDLINQLYLCLFGLLMMVIDFPLDIARMREMKLSIYKYLLFMTRFTGRGFWYLFLGINIFGTLFENNINPFLGFILGGFVVTVGLISIYYGISKSNKLEHIRMAMMAKIKQEGGHLDIVCPPQGLSDYQFQKLAKDLAGIDLSDEEVDYVLNAVSFTVKADNIFSKEEFQEWTKGRMAIL